MPILSMYVIILKTYTTTFFMSLSSISAFNSYGKIYNDTNLFLAILLKIFLQQFAEVKSHLIRIAFDLKRMKLV